MSLWPVTRFYLANQSTKVIPPYLVLTLDMSYFLDHSQHSLKKGHIYPTSTLLSYSQELSCKKFLEGGKFIFVSWKIHTGGRENDLIVKHVISLKIDILY